LDVRWDGEALGSLEEFLLCHLLTSYISAEVRHGLLSAPNKKFHVAFSGVLTSFVEER
jgi:hypothetical protein